MIEMVQVIRLGGGKQNAVDARADELAQQRAPADAEAIEDRGERAFEIAHRIGPGVEGGERIDQHHLTVEAHEVVVEERPHHDVLIGRISPRHHGAQRMRARGRFSVELERREGERRRAGEIARHQETAGRQQAHGIALVAAGLQIGGEQLRRLERGLLILGGVGIERCQIARARGPRAARADPGGRE